MRVYILIISFFLSACGFTPLYGNLDGSTSTNAELQTISIRPLEGRTGQLLTNHLAEKFYTNNTTGDEKFELIIIIEENVDRYGFNQDRSTTREGYTLKTRFKLLNISSGEEVTQGLTTQNTSYDVVQSDFSNASAKQDALERMLLETAQRITILLSTHFKNSE